MHAWMRHYNDVIRSVPACDNSRIQGITEYHDDSCARLKAFLNSRAERGHQDREKQSVPVSKVRRLAGKKPVFLSRRQGRWMLRRGQVATIASA